MLRGTLRALLAATALSPVLLTWAYVLYKSTGSVFSASLPVVGACVLVLVCWGLIRAAASTLADVAPFDSVSVKPADNDLVTFVLTYLLPLVGQGNSSVDMPAIAFAVALLFLIVLSTHAYHTNPLLALMGYHFYEIESSNGVTYSVISKRSISSAKDVRKVKMLAPFVLLDSTE